MSPIMSKAKNANTASAKHIQFSNNISLVVVSRKTDEENAACWYTEKDKRRFKKEALMESLALQCTRTARAMELSMLFYISEAESSHISSSEMAIKKEACDFLHNARFHGQEHYRGIERYLSPRLAEFIDERRHAAVANVLKEQARQRMHGGLKHCVLSCKWNNEADAAEACALRIAQISRMNSFGEKQWSHWVSNMTS